MDRAIVAGLEKAPYQIELYEENLEATLFPDEATQHQFREWYIHKYRNRRPDLIIAVGSEPLKFMVESHATGFPGVPIVFCGSTVEMLEQLKLDPSFTGVWGIAQPEKTLNLALRLQPTTKHVVVVGGVGKYDRYLEAIARESFRKYESSVEFTYLTDLDMPTLLERLKHLPSHTIIYHTSIMEDAAGTRFIDATQSVPMVAGAANAPVFVVDDVDVGGGSVGGYVFSFAVQGQVAAEMAVRVLSGEKPENIPIFKSANIYMFDWRAIQRWGFKEHDLPPGSVVLYRQPDLWESYKWYIVGGISLMLLETLLLFGLVWQRSQRRKAEETLRESERRFRLVANTAPVMIWMSGPDALRNYFNQPWFEFTGRPVEEDLGRGWANSVHPEDLKACMDIYKNAFDQRESFRMQYRLRRNDGEYRWLFDVGVPRFGPGSSFAGYIGSCIDITDRKKVEEAFANLSGLLIEAHEEERRRIAGELHDDFSQRLAVLANDLGQTADNSPIDLGRRLHQLWNDVSELAADLHSLSHGLHSSTLESLGLVAGVSSFCEEFEYQQGIQIDFAHENIPHDISEDAALCLFRVVQEALRNVKRHSGVESAEVRLEESRERLHLSVYDKGRGFDLSQRSTRDGIGIRSMEERVRLLGGQFEIRSDPTMGTRIDAWLPLKAGMRAA